MVCWVDKPHDWLTGVLAVEAIPLCVGEVLREQPDGPHAALLFGLDGFRGLNDAYGHREGDQLLRAFADLLAGFARADEPVGRAGGDQFLILLRGADQKRARAVADRVLGALAKKPFHGRAVTASVGFAFYPSDGADAGTLIAKARASLSKAKAARKS